MPAPVLLLAARLALLAKPAPALAGGFECPEAGGAEWREVRTAHFAVRTDLSSRSARNLAEELERVHEVVRYGLFAKPPETGVVGVVALRDEEEYDLFAPKDSLAHYETSLFSRPVIVLYDTGADTQRVIVAHEIAHHVAARAFARQPRWFSEGLACYMESVATVGTPTVGGIPKHRHAEVYPYHGSVARVLRSRDRLETSRDYATAWALVHYLLNRRPQEFRRLQQGFARGQDPAAVWREAFPKWDVGSDEAMEDLDGEIGRYVAHGEFRYRDVKLPDAEPPTERPMSAAEAHDVRLSLAWSNRGKPVDAALLQAEVEEALRHDPGCVPALWRAMRKRPAEAVALAEKATALHPQDARAWLLLAHALPQEAGARRVEALLSAVRAEPSNPTALNELAWQLLGMGRAVEATPLARRAVELQPGAPENIDTLSAIAEARGDCAPALTLQRRAVDLLSESSDAEEVARYRERLERLEAACGRAAAPAAAK